jgi:hypothetical protein
MKQKTYLTVLLYLLLQFCLAQRRTAVTKDSLQPQHWGTSCWAAATANVVNFSRHVVDECQIIDIVIPPQTNYGQKPVCDEGELKECAELGSRSFLIDGDFFTNSLLKKYASFSTLKKRANHALSYRQILSIVTQNKPMIHWFDYDVLSEQSHVVNIIGYNTFARRIVDIAGKKTYINIDKNHQRWLYVYDPKPNCIGTYYLKNYQTYQLASPFGEGAYQDTYFDFKLKNSTRSKTYHSYIEGQLSTNNIYNPEGDSLLFVKRWFADFWNLLSTNNEMVKKMTGLDKGTINDSDLLLGSPLDIHRVEARDSANTKIQQIVIRKDAIEKVIPVLKCAASDSIPTFISAIIVRHSPTDSTQIVIDRIQALNIPESVVKEIKLRCPSSRIGTSNSVTVQKPTDLRTLTIGAGFIDTREGFQFLEFTNNGLTKIYDIHNRFNATNSILLREDFINKLGKNYFGNSINSSVSKTINKSDLLLSNSNVLDNKLTSFNLTTKTGIAIPISESKASIMQLKDYKRIKEIIFYQQHP